jgi:hypothetical protein
LWFFFVFVGCYFRRRRWRYFCWGVVAFIAENYDDIIINSSTLALKVLKTPSVLGASPLPPHARVFFDARAKVAAGSKIIVNPADR